VHKLKVLDCTLRDGGLTNNFKFDKRYIQDHLRAMALAGVDYAELGYKADKRIFDPFGYGLLKFCEDEDILRLIEGVEKLPKLSFMVDEGRFERDKISDASQSPFMMSRLACYLNEVEQAIDDLCFLYNKGYETTLNIMAISTESHKEIVESLRKIRKWVPFTTVYVVDSYGALYPDQLKRLVTLYKEELSPMEVGIHAHNNMQLAFSNTIMAIEAGASFVDASVNGMGRGAGNCPLECLLPYINKSDYNLKPIFSLLNNYFERRDSDHNWGYSSKQLLTGIFNQHPVKSIQNVGDDLAKIYDKFQSGVEA